MKKYLTGLLLAMAASAAFAAPTQAPAPAMSSPTQTLEVAVDGLNCALCSEKLKTQMKSAAGARDIEPRLECGRIYVEMAGGKKLNESELSFLLLANGFNLKSVKPTTKSLVAVRSTAPESCS